MAKAVISNVFHSWEALAGDDKFRPGLGFVAVFDSEDECEKAYPQFLCMDGKVRTQTTIPAVPIENFVARDLGQEA